MNKSEDGECVSLGHSSTTQMACNVGKAQTERACAISWFSNWPQDKRQVFLDRLREKQSLDLAAESLLADLDRMSLQQGM